VRKREGGGRVRKSTLRGRDQQAAGIPKNKKKRAEIKRKKKKKNRIRMEAGCDKKPTSGGGARSRTKKVEKVWFFPSRGGGNDKRQRKGSPFALGGGIRTGRGGRVEGLKRKGLKTGLWQDKGGKGARP